MMLVDLLSLLKYYSAKMDIKLQIKHTFIYDTNCGAQTIQ